MALRLTTQLSLTKLPNFHNYPKLLLGVILFASNGAVSFAKNTSLELTHQDITDVVQDRNGMLWLAKRTGLYRFDGVHTIDYNEQFEQAPFGWSEKLLFNDGDLYVATHQQGIWRYGKNKDLELLVDFKDLEEAVFSLVIVNRQLFFLTTKHGLMRFDLSKRTLHRISQGNKRERPGKLYYSAGKVWKVDKDSVEYIDLQDGKSPEIKTLYTGDVSAAMAQGDSLYFATPNHLYHYHDSLLSRSSLDVQIVQMAASSKLSRFWSVTDDGIILQHKLNGEYTQVGYSNTATSFVIKIIEDHFGVLWFLTDSGLRTAKPNQFEHMNLNFSEHYNYLNTATDESGIWIATYGQGVYLKQDGSSEAVPVKAINDALVTPYSKRVDEILIRRNKIYVATFDGIYVWDKLTNQVSRMDDSDGGSVFLDAAIYSHRLYAATDDDGLHIFDLSTQKRIKKYNVDNSALESNEVLYVLRDSTGLIWIAAADGVYVLQSSTDKIEKLKLNSLSKITALYEVNRKMYVSTLSNGVFVLQLDGTLINQFLRGYSVETPTSIGEQIYFPSNRGLHIANVKNDVVSLVDGTENWAFYDSVKKYKGKLVIANNSGLLYLNMEPQKVSNPKVVISRVTIGNRSLIDRDSVTLSSRYETVTLHLATLDYRNLSNHRYRYRINSGPFQLFNSRTLTLTGFDSGEHQIEIQGTDSLGLWSSNDAYFQVIVEHPWYWNRLSQTIYIAILLSVSFALIWLYKLRALALNTAHKVLQEELVVKEKTNALVQLSLERINQLAQGRNAIQKLGEISNLATDTLQQLEKQHNQRLPDMLGERSLATALPLLVDYFQRRYNCKIMSNNEVTVDLPYDIQADIYRATYELISLSILEAHSREVEFTIKLYNEKIWLICNDNGRSLSMLSKHVSVSVGMHLLQQIAEKYQSRIDISKRKHTGNSMVLSLFIRDHFEETFAESS